MNSKLIFITYLTIAYRPPHYVHLKEAGLRVTRRMRTTAIKRMKVSSEAEVQSPRCENVNNMLGQLWPKRVKGKAPSI